MDRQLCHVDGQPRLHAHAPGNTPDTKAWVSFPGWQHSVCPLLGKSVLATPAPARPPASPAWHSPDSACAATRSHCSKTWPEVQSFPSSESHPHESLNLRVAWGPLNLPLRVEVRMVLGTSKHRHLVSGTSALASE